MSARYGKIILTNKDSVWFLEAGTKGRVYKAFITKVKDIDSGQTNFPDRLLSRVVEFSLDENGDVELITLLESLDGYRDTDCGEHEISARTSGASDCECGNPMSPSMIRCVVCSLRDDKCVYCDNAIN